MKAMSNDWIRAFLCLVGCCWLLLFFPSCKVESKTSCYANLSAIDGAKQTWAAEHGKTNGAAVTQADLLPFLRKMPECPKGGSYTIGLIGEPPKCSFLEHRYP